jgi:opacity protein-like surface antigen
MKLTTLILFFVFLTFTLTAQDRRGSWLIDGGSNMSFSDTRIEELMLAGGGGIPVPRPTSDHQLLSASSHHTGYFLTDRFLVGSRIFYSKFTIESDNFLSDEEGRLTLRPFLRYYLLQPASGKFRAFGELGFGTIGAGRGENWETDFHLGIGAERVLAPDVLASANLNYEAMASGMNFTTLTLGLHTLTGQLTAARNANPMRAGSFATDAQWLNASYGRMKRGEDVQSDLTFNLTPSLGYFITRGLMAEVGLNMAYARRRDDSPFLPNFTTISNSTFAAVRAGGRYYPLRVGRLAPFVMGQVQTRWFQQSVTSQSSSSSESGETSFGWLAGAGANYFLSDRIALDLTVTYGRERSELELDFVDFELEPTRERQVRATLGMRFFLPAD